VNFELWDLALLFLCVKIGGTVFAKLRQPSLIGELLAGAVLGTVVVGLNGSATIQVVAQLGVMFLILLTMLSIDLSSIEQEMERLIVAQILTAIMIFVLLMGLFSYLALSLDMVLVVGAAIFGSCTVIAVRTLSSIGELGSREGQAVVGLQVINGIVELLLISSAINILQYQEFTFEPVLKLVLMVIGTFAVMSRIGYRFINNILNSVQVLKMDEVLFALTLLLAFTSAAVTEAVGLTNYLGIMLVGVLISRTQQAGSISTKIKELGEGFFIPIFFGSLGLSVALFGIFENINLLVVLLFSFSLIRFTAFLVPTLFSGYSFLDACKIASGMMPMSEYGLLMISLGMSYGVLTEALYSTLIVIFLIVNVTAPVATNLLFRVHGVSFSRERRVRSRSRRHI
jgi:Kef-type K+ transport system membrane component KefB